MKYRNKPVIIEAFKWSGGPDQEEDPEWIIEAIKEGTAWFRDVDTPDVKLCIDTGCGVMLASVGDYIIQETGGRLFPCKPDVFEAAYEPVKKSILLKVRLTGGEEHTVSSISDMEYMVSWLNDLCCESREYVCFTNTNGRNVIVKIGEIHSITELQE